MIRQRYRDGLLVKMDLNGKASCPLVFLTDSACKFLNLDVAEEGEEEQDSYLEDREVCKRERAAASSLLLVPPDPAPVFNIDARELPGQLVHDWVAFPRVAILGVWAFVGSLPCLAQRRRVLGELKDLTSLMRGACRRSADSRVVARIFCWSTDDVVWANAADALASVEEACLICGRTNCGEHDPRNVLDYCDDRPLIPVVGQNVAWGKRDPRISWCALECCERREGKPGEFQRCSRCRVASYCSREHQVQDWSKHKPKCSEMLTERGNDTKS